MVTGSSFLLENGSHKILVDCGMFQGSKPVRALNYRDFAFDPASLDCVLLTHAHIDHSGLLPKLCKQGFKGPIYATKVTAELCNIMLPDSAHIQEFDAEIANRKGRRAGKKAVEPLYTVAEAFACLQQFPPVAYDQQLDLVDEIRVVFHDAGHILGSSIVELNVTEGAETVKLLFSGDLGQPDQPILRDPTFISRADYIITEATYGNRTHEQYDKEEKLAEIINATVDRGGNIIIPSFAVGRTQALLYHLHSLLKAGKIPDIPVIIDSPLAISATDIFLHNTQEYDSEAYAMILQDQQNPLKLPQLKFTKTAEESKALNHLDTPAIIISASGMADAGRILHHLKHNLWRPESSVLFVGYQAEGSLGRRLIEGVKRVKIMGEEISVKAAIYNLDGFSAHADQAQLLEWLKYFAEPKPANIFLVHGESTAAEPLAALIREQLELSSYIPRYGEVAVITGRKWHIEQTELAALVPEVKELEDYLNQAEADYRLQRRQLIELVAEHPGKLPEAIIRMEKVLKYLKKLVKDL